MGRSEHVYRNKLLQVISGVATAMFLGTGLAIALDHSAPPYLGGLVGTAGAYLAWMIGWQSSIRLNAAGVMVDNLFLRVCVPWDSFREFQIANGLVIVMTDGRAVGSFAFGGSVIGQVTKYRRMRKTVACMEEGRREVCDGQRQSGAVTGGVRSVGEYRSRAHFVLWPALATLIPLELIGLLTTLHR